MKIEKALIFTVNKCKYCLDVSKVQEIIILKEEISKLPKQKDYFDGTILVRDNVVNIINTAKFLGMESEPLKKGEDFLIILNNKEDGTNRKGLRVKSVENILDVSNVEEKSLGIVKSEYAQEAFILSNGDKEEIVVILNL